ncbi:MAG: hypothetical protein WCF84_16805 [Anaerolineae bacterium]
METTLTVRDRTTQNMKKDALVFMLALPSERITVRELIRARIDHEVQDYNSRQSEYFVGLVQPSDTEMTLNGYRMRKIHVIDPDKQYRLALESFEHNGFIVLVDDRQVDGLDQVIEIGPTTAVTFLKLVPLVGG